MKLKNISIGDFIEAKNKHGGDVGFDVLEVGKSYEVLGFSKSSELTVIISVPNHKTFSDGFYVRHECFRKPKPQLKQLDQSVFDGIDEKWQFAAVDKCGEVWYSTHKTQPSVSGTHLSPEPNADSMQAKGYYDASNWQNSLIERDTAKELTGSELCKAMLERGDKYVMCLVFDDTRNLDVTYVIRGYYDGYFHTKLNSWENAVPINNQGEPLTAAEVGL